MVAGGVDQGHFLQLLVSSFEGAVATHAQHTLDKYSELVVYFVKDAHMVLSTGLAIYWPSRSYDYKRY